MACSENARDRARASSQLSLLKITEQSTLFPVVQMLLLFAARSTSEMRINFQKAEAFDEKNTAIDLLKNQCMEILKQKTDLASLSIKENIQPAQIGSAFKLESLKTANRKIPDLKTPPKTALKFELPEHFIMIMPTTLEVLEMAEIPLETSLKHSKLEFPKKLAESLKPPIEESAVVKKEFARVQDSVSINHNETKEVKTLKITPEIYQQLIRQPAVFDIEIASRMLQAEDQKDQILALANQPPIESPDSLIHALKLMGKKKREFTIDDLIILFLQKDAAALQERNPSLSDVDIQELSMMMTMYLINTTEIANLEGIKKSLEAAATAADDQKEIALQDLSDRLLHERKYDPTKDNAMLVFEHYSGKRLRQKQVETIHKMTLGHSKEVRNLVTQLIMGSGKSKVILPLLAYLNSRGDNVPMIVVPDFLYETNLEDMRVLSGGLLNQEIETIHIDEGQQLSIEKLDQILRTMQRVKENKSYCLVKASTVHHLHLHFKETIIELSANPNNITFSRYAKLKEVLNIFKNEVDCIVDEVDMVLDCLKEVNFSAGTRTPISEASQNSLEAIFKGIDAEPTLQKFFSLEKDTETSFDENKYKNEIKPLLVKILLQLADCDSASQDEMERYLLADRSNEKLPAFMQNASKETKNLLSLGKECINTLLPLALKKTATSITASPNSALPIRPFPTPAATSQAKAVNLAVPTRQPSTRCCTPLERALQLRRYKR